MIKAIYKVLISLNVYSLYFVKSFWLKKTSFSPDLKHSYSLSILLLLHASIILLISKYWDTLNWKLFIAMFLFYHITIALIFNSEILKAVANFNHTPFSKYYPIFISYLLIGLLSLILLLLS